MAVLGTVGFRYIGVYDATKEYVTGNVVTYDGSSYVMIKYASDGVSKTAVTGVAPDADDTTWKIMAEGISESKADAKLKEAVSTAEASAKKWAVGNDESITEGSDTDNAKAYAKAAQEAAEKASAVSDVGIATATKAGIVKVDDDTIKVDADGTLRVGHLLILKITFSEEFKGKAYTVTGNGETFTGTVPNSLYINLFVHGLDAIYTVSAEYEGETYTSEVETKDFYGVYFGELTAWQATITVTVTDVVAGAVEGALVTATSTEKEYTRTTNAEGKAEIKVGKPGTYTIVAKIADGELTDTQEVVVDTDKGTYTVNVSYLKIVTWADGTDEEVAAMVAAADRGEIKLSDYWGVGDERKVKLSAMAATGVGESHAEQTVTMVLMNEGGVPLADGSECNFVVGQKNGLTENGYMNSSDTNSGSWGNCARRKWCNEVYFAALPTYLQNMFKKMTTKTPLTETGSDWQSVEDMIALPSGAQVWATDAAAAATTPSTSDGNSHLAKADFSGDIVQFEWYRTSANRIKKNGDSSAACNWWERSPSDVSNHRGQCFCLVVGDGSAAYDGASTVCALAPFGCI